MKAPEDCHSMPELREAIDAFDREIVAMLAKRATYMDRAVILKQEVQWPAYIQSRIDDVLNKVVAAAEETDELDGEIVHKIWTLLIDWSIQREKNTLGEVHSDVAYTLPLTGRDGASAAG